MTTEAAERPQTKPFAAFLQEHPGGLHQELSDGLADVVLSVLEQKKKGKVTLTLNVAPTKVGTVEIDGVVKLAAPTPPAQPGMFWPDEHGNLHRGDPRQPEIEGLREVSKPADSAAPKVVGA